MDVQNIITLEIPTPAIHYVASSSSYVASSTAMTISAPSGILAGDFLIFWSLINSTPTVTDNNGSTPVTQILLRSFSTTDGEYYLGYRIAGSSEPATYQWTLNSAQRTSNIMSVYRGVSAFDITPSASTETKGESDTIATVGLIPGELKSIVIAACGVDTASDSVYLTSVDGFSLRKTAGTGGYKTAALYDKLLFSNNQNPVLWQHSSTVSVVTQIFNLK